MTSTGPHDARRHELLRITAEHPAAGSPDATASELVGTAARYGASTADQITLALAAHQALRGQPGAAVSLRLVQDDDRADASSWSLEVHLLPARTTDRNGDRSRLLAVSVPASPETAPDAAPEAPVPGPAALSAHLLELLAGQNARLRWHDQELERTDQGTLALHAELAEITEQLRQANRIQAHLLQAEREARAHAENTRSRLSFLAHASATLSASLDPQQILGRLDTLVAVQRVAALEIWLAEEDTASPRGAGLALVVPGTAPSPAAPARPPHVVRRAHRTGLVHHAAPHRLEDPPGVTTGTADRELLAVPLISRGRALGVLAFSPLREPFTAEDVTAYGELGRLSAVALDNAMRYEHEHQIAERLQHALLTDLPTDTPVRFTARYLPGEDGLNVGGDWYDAFTSPDGSIIASLGDVTGHGLHAAILMGQLRTAIRAYALDGYSPGQILKRLNRLLISQTGDDMATAVLMHLTADGTLHWANAGHPPPLLRRPDGTTAPLRSRNMMLGVFDDAPYTTHTAHLAPGATLLLYTDGVIERRDVPLEATQERLAKAFAAATDDLEQTADQILEAMLIDSTREDDTCILLLHAPAAVPDEEAPDPDDRTTRLLDR
ncbi:PP2C family protein-serine/threonine phosphatase [Actinomadura opuntiae]|uniref:PP2C family protein-serine/threonine phosphatase n=1 Tax=Actinomadura sp. OS1-43 TaxID=604315 RepID=UPI00255ABE3C|nr:GAF domain-containing SpoIIE family protein phosphatase [Actinomadura sp. OS1-43]MDL4814432.1 SpoIIE family protein phosphatase [Actinomadura sp. OS1-43]